MHYDLALMSVNDIDVWVNYFYNWLFSSLDFNTSIYSNLSLLHTQIPKDDKLSRNKSCLPFFRSSPACLNGQRDAQHVRQQMNSVTSFIDASTVYGHSKDLEKILRNLSGSEGLLAVNSKYTDKGLPYLPFVSVQPSACLQDPGSERVECFAAGDSRVNEILPLSVLHTLWVREHNRLAKHLTRLNPHWGSEVIYQETRKIIGALHQVRHRCTVKNYFKDPLKTCICVFHLKRIL